jgi:hypothetical protein
MATPQLSSLFGDAGRRTPVTIGLTALVVLGAVLTLGASAFMRSTFGFDGSLFPKLWTVATYPFVNDLGALGLVFLPLWLLSIGGSVERDHTPVRFAVILGILILLSMLPFLILSRPLYGILVPNSALTAIWATRQPNATVMIFGLVPVKAKWIGWLGVASVLVTYGAGNLPLGVLALVSSLTAYLFASNRLPVRYGYSQYQIGAAKQTKAQKVKEDAYLSDVFLREQERAERERLRRLFEGSLEDDKK